MIRILLADDHELIRFAIRALFNEQSDIELVGEARSFSEVIDLCQQTKPDIVLLNLHLNEGEITPKISEIVRYCPLVLILTGYNNKKAHLYALRLGAIGIVTKDQSIEIILKAIRAVVSGEVWIDRALSMDLWRSFTQVDETIPLSKLVAESDYTRLVDTIDNGITSSAESIITLDKSKLTTRELEIACLAARGLPAKKIAAKLFISDKTVRNQLVVIYSKLEVSSQVQLVIEASSLGLLDKPNSPLPN